MPAIFGLTLAAYLTWVVASTYWSFAPDVSVASTVQMFIRGALVVAFSFVIPQYWRRLTEGYLFGAFVLAIWILIAGEEQYVGRLTLLGGDENALGLSITVGFAIAMVRVSESRAFASIFYLAAATVMGVATLATGSRTGLVALCVVALIRILSRRQRKRAVQLSFMAIGLSALSTFLWRSGRVPERIASFINAGEVTDTRGSILHLYFSYPDWMIFGVGLNADAYYLQQKAGQFLYVHNLYIGTWVQLGAIGLALLVGLLAIVGFQAWHSERRDIWLASVAPALVYSMTLPGQTSNVYWFLIALGVAGNLGSRLATEDLNRRTPRRTTQNAKS